jgi:hypothetical protein
MDYFIILLKLLVPKTDELTPLGRVLLEKLVVAELVKIFLFFYETQKLITALKTDRH